MTETAIEYQHVCKRFDNEAEDVVKDVSLSIPEGSFVTILGRSGCGKTTLLKLTNRLYELTSGRIMFYGQDSGQIPVNDYRRQIGYVIQQGGLFPHKTIEENIATVPKLLKWDKDTITATVHEMMNFVQLDYDTYAKRYPRQLSGGQQQRVGIARALAAKPRLMLMDEPFGAIDAITRRSLQTELLNLHKTLKNTILFVTHDIFEAILLGERIIIMDHGQVQQYDTPYNIMMHPANDFVRDLVFSGDPLEKLKALSMTTALEPPRESDGVPGTNVVHPDDQLNTALLVMLRDNTRQVFVIGDSVLGVVRLETIRQLLTDDEE